MKSYPREHVPIRSADVGIATLLKHKNARRGKLREPNFGSPAQRAPVKLLSLTLLLAVIVSGCSTVATFKIPAGATLVLENKKLSLGENGECERPPFFWSAAGGIPYRIEVDGVLLSEGKLRAKFRFGSIFWPPMALIYWPMGFDKAGYDFTRPSPNITPKSKQ